MNGLREAETAAIDGHQEDASEWIAVGAEGNEVLELVGPEDSGNLWRRPRDAGAGEEDRDVLTEEDAVEGPEELDGEGYGAVGDLRS